MKNEKNSNQNFKKSFTENNQEDIESCNNIFLDSLPTFNNVFYVKE